MKTIVIFLFMFGFYIAEAENKLDFELVVAYEGDVTRLTAGYSDSTTNNFDEEYEDDLPPFTPPNGILAAFRINREFEDGSSELIFSYKDYREVPTEIDTVDYILDVLGTREEGKEFYFAVPQSGLSDKIKEIRIIDRVSGTIIDSNIRDGIRFHVSNRFINNFIVRVKYEKVETSIEIIDDESVFYSNGVIYSDNNNRVLELFDVNGQKYIDRVRINKTFDIEFLPNGIYFAYIYDDKFAIKLLKIVKL